MAHDQPVNIAMWGASGGGKTVFLTAVQIAAVQPVDGRPPWAMFGQTSNDNDDLAQRYNELVGARKFPQGTLKSEGFKWKLAGVEAPSRLRRLMGRDGRHVSFSIGMHDIPGLAFLPGSPEAEAAVDYLSQADGILYLHDPTRDLGLSDDIKDPGKDNLEYFMGVVKELMRIKDEAGGLIEHRLPQFLAVCVTKFDDTSVFQLAMENGYPSEGTDAARQPRIADEDARSFFDLLCAKNPAATAEMLRSLIDASFVHDRVRFFVTSSIGFYVGESGRFDEKDGSNVVRIDTEPRVRGDVRPINVLEPLVWLEKRIRSVR